MQPFPPSHQFQPPEEYRSQSPQRETPTVGHGVFLAVVYIIVGGVSWGDFCAFLLGWNPIPFALLGGFLGLGIACFAAPRLHAMAEDEARDDPDGFQRRWWETIDPL